MSVVRCPLSVVSCRVSKRGSGYQLLTVEGVSYSYSYFYSYSYSEVLAS